MKQGKRIFTLLALLVMTLCLAFTAVACEDEAARDSSSTGKDSASAPKATYTVMFETNGGSAIESASVTEGEKLAKPASPKKEGYAFVGWYLDGAFEYAYDFSAPVNSRLKLYARYAQYTEKEFAVNYYVDGNLYATASTAGGVVYDMPEPTKAGDEFIGWWMSDYEDATKLTAKYAGEAVYEDRNLYAAWKSGSGLNVTEKAITWQAKGANQTYYVTVTTPSGTGTTEMTQGTSYAYNFADAAAGEYTVTLRYGKNTFTNYFVNRGLAHVTRFNFENDVMYFDPVPNATNYTLMIDCGNEDHVHTAINLGTDTYYDFSDCEMQPGGITFEVTANAANYASSTSRLATYEKTLAEVKNITYEADGTVTWTPVENAEYYVVCVRVYTGTATLNQAAPRLSAENGGYTDYYFTTTDPNFSLKQFTGNFTVTVTPQAKGYNAPSTPATSETIAKAELATPADFAISGNTLTWTAVEGATGYTVKVGNNEYIVEGTEYTLTAVTADTTVAVKANGAKDSFYTDAITVNTTAITGLRYESGRVYWNAVYGADTYTVKVNDGAAKTVNTNSASVTLTKEGANTVTVAYGANEASVEVTAYAIAFDTEGADEVATMYLAKGDEVVLPTPELTDRVFGGWYSTAKTETSGKKYEDVYFAGKATTLYAFWTYPDIEVTLVYGNGYETQTVEITYGTYYQLPVLESKDGLNLFTGWYTEDKAEGVKIADEKGNRVNSWNLLTTTKLYAGWFEVLKVYEIENGAEYSIGKGQYINNVRTVTIPETVNGKPVTYIEANAFDGTYLTEINIPDTIKTIEMGVLTNSFRNCKSLRNVNIYETDNPDKGNYFSEDGILYYNNEIAENGGVELRYAPLGRTGALIIPDFVEVIPYRAVTYSAYYEIYIPASVRLIDKEAFAYNSYLRKVVFEETPEGNTEIPLTIGNLAFQTDHALTEITLPKRLTALLPEDDSNMSSFGRIMTFENSTKLKEINVEEGCTAYSSKDGMLCTADGTKIILAPVAYAPAKGKFTVPSGVYEIEEYAFWGVNSLKTVIIPGYVTEIGEYAFAGRAFNGAYPSIEKITVEGAVEDNTLSVGAYAFYGQTNLTNLDIPANVTAIGAHAFGNTPKLLTVSVDSYGSINYAEGAFTDNDGVSYINTLNIGKNVGELGSIGGVFGTNAMKRVNIDPENANYYSTTVEEDGFGGVVYNKDKTRILFYPNALEGAYTLLATTTEIPANVFENRKYLTGVTVGSAVTAIGNAAFKGATLLSYVNFEEGTAALTIGNDAFRNCTALLSFEVKNRVTSIGNYAFNGNTAMILPSANTLSVRRPLRAAVSVNLSR